MKFKTTTFKGYSYDASYYINNDASCYIIDGEDCKKNADAVIKAMRADYGPGARIVSCGNETFFGRPDYGMQLQGDCVEYSIIYNPMETIAEKREYSFLHSDGERIAGEYWIMKNNLTFPTREKPLPWQRAALCIRRRAMGKIPTSKQLFILGRWRRGIVQSSVIRAYVM